MNLKHVIKQWRQFATSTKHLSQGLLANSAVVGQEFCKADESLEDEKHTGQPSEVDNGQLRAIIEADPLTTTWEVAKELKVDHSVVVWHWKQIGKVKNLDKWVHLELIKIQKKIISLKCHLLILHNNEPFLNQIVICDEKWTVYNNRQ